MKTWLTVAMYLNIIAVALNLFVISSGNGGPTQVLFIVVCSICAYYNYERLKCL